MEKYLRGFLGSALMFLTCCNGGVSHVDPDIEVVVADGTPDYMHVPDLERRVLTIVEKSAEYFKHDSSELNGLRIVFVPSLDGDMNPCQISAQGCYQAEAQTIWISTDDPNGDRLEDGRWHHFSMVESTVLPHELLHLFIGDPQHAGPEWNTFWELYTDLHKGRICTALMECPGEPQCDCPYVGQWLPYFYGG